MPGVRVRYNGQHGGLVLIPLMDRPYSGQSLDMCPTCRVVHPVKTLHLWMEPDNTCIVAVPVKTAMDKAGCFKPGGGWAVANQVSAPPPLRLGFNTSRAQIDQANRRMNLWFPTSKGA